MAWPGIIVLVVVLGLVAALLFVLIRHNYKRLLIIRAASRATDQQLQEIYQLVAAQGVDSSHGFVLGRTQEIIDDPACIVTVPASLKKFPWAGRSIAVKAGRDVQFHLLTQQHTSTQLLGRKYLPVAVPRVRGKSGKIKNQFAPSRYLKGNRELQEKLSHICSPYPAELLSYLLCAGMQSFEFEPINQGRIGTNAAWVQDPEPPSCNHCNRKMLLIVQLPGTLLHPKAFHNGTFYLFGCREHPENISSVAQYT